MCAQHTQSHKNKWLSPPVIYLLMIFLGIYSGLSDIAILKVVGAIVSDVFIKIFKCISLPIITLSIIVTLSGYHSSDIMKKIWRKTILYTLSTTIIAAFISFLLYLLVNPSLVSKVGGHVAPEVQPGDYLSHITSIIPNNFLSPFINNHVMSALFLGIVTGIATRFIKEDAPRDTIIQFFKGLHGLLMVMTKWIIAIIPIGLFGFITTSVVQLKSGVALKGIGEYLMIIVLSNLIQGLIVLPLWLKIKGIRPYAMMKSMSPALSLAFFSKSSAGSLPVTMSTIEKSGGVRPQISRFVLPLCISINMNGCAAFIFTTVIYLMKNHGVEVSTASMVVWIFIATIAAIGNAGVPMGCFFLSASLLVSMDVPITLMGIILPFYSLIDMLETSVNVWSDSCVTKVVDEEVKHDDLSSQYSNQDIKAGAHKVVIN